MSAEKNNTENSLNNIFKRIFNSFPEKITKLPNSGSSREYYRITDKKTSIIGVYNENFTENKAFLNFTEQFLNSRSNVPNILYEDIRNNIYLLSDLGDLTLLEWLISNRRTNKFPKEAIPIYKNVLQELIKMQIVAGKSFDYTSSYPFKEFNKEAIVFDLNYFKNNFAKALKFDFNENILNSEFNMFSNYLLDADDDYFMFRDFQARNIMLVDQTPYFIDYQGGRKGALQYDLASLLFQAKAEIPETVKLELLNYYISVAKLFTPINKDEFIEYFFGFALIRVLQTLGAYGFRGIIERKSHFIESIPYAINNLRYLYNKVEITNKLPEIKNLINLIINTELNINC